MAGMKGSHRFFTSPAAIDGDGDHEFEESDVWGFDSRPEDLVRLSIPSSRSARKKSEKVDRSAAAAALSLPVSIPDWPKAAKGRSRQGFEREGGGDEDGSVVPPHELLWRRRAVSFSVQEGVGRTLKGRDLSRVRDAIWQRTGFED